MNILCGAGAPARESFWVAQRRGPQQARFWLDGVEGFSAAISERILLGASAPEGSLP